MLPNTIRCVGVFHKKRSLCQVSPQISGLDDRGDDVFNLLRPCLCETSTPQSEQGGQISPLR